MSEETKKVTCPVCKKKVDFLEVVTDCYGIPYRYACTDPKCIKKVKSELVHNYRDPSY